MSDSANLLFLAGSTRQDSFNRKLAHAAFRNAQDRGHAAELVELSDYPMPIYNGDLEAQDGPPENARKLKNVFRRHQGIFIASPEYNASITPLLKNTLDWMSRVKDDDASPLAVFKTRVFAIGGASPGGYGGMRSLMTLRQVLSLGLGALVLPEQIAVGNAGSVFDSDGALTDERMRTMLDGVVGRLGEAAKQFAS